MGKLMSLVLAALFLLALALPAAACDPVAASLCGTDPFTPQTKYMSHAGYLRWQEYRAHGDWLPMRDAVVMTQDQLKLCPFVIEESHEV